MNNPLLVANAIQHARYLAETIGPRPAGSPAEKRGLDYTATCMAKWGYQVEHFPVQFAPSTAVQYPYMVGIFALAGCGLALPYLPWLALGLPFLNAALPQWTMWAARRRKPSAQSENVFASMQPLLSPSGSIQSMTDEKAESANPYTSLILVAHMDSARAIPFHSRFWLRLYNRTMDIIQRIAVMLSLLGALHWVGFRLPTGLLTAGTFIAIFTAAGWLFVQLWGCWRCEYSPGAIDNASGIGVLLALAEYYASQQPQNLRLGFLFTSSEETGAHGAAAFADEFYVQGGHSAILVLDMVGAGDILRYVSEDGVYFPIRTDARLNQMIKTAYPQASPQKETLRSGDHAAFIRRGFPTAALQAHGSHQAELAYHSIYDTVELLDSETFDMVVQCLVDLTVVMEDEISNKSRSITH